MTHPTAIIIGTGRSGTSTTARILHEMGICMGHHMKMGEPGGGDYEDYFAHGLNMMIAARTLGARKWLRIMNEYHADCEAWGAKDPWFLYWTHDQLRTMAPRLIVRTWRPLEESIESWAKMRERIGRKDVDKVRPHIRQLFGDRERRADAIQENGFNVVRLCYDTKRSDEEIRQRIREGLAA